MATALRRNTGAKRYFKMSKEAGWQALAQHFAGVDTLLAGRKVKTNVVNMANPPAAAWTVDNLISFNLYKLPQLSTMDDFIVAQGANWHELGHVMFTPSFAALRNAYGTRNWDSCGLVDSLESGDLAYRYAWNILEDQRIETLITMYFKSSKQYLTMMMATLVFDDSCKGREFLFSHGRRYLPIKMRRAFRRTYVNQSDVVAIRRIIDTYRLLDLSDHDDLILAHQCVVEFSAIIAQVPGTQPPPSCGHGSPNVSLDHGKGDGNAAMTRVILKKWKKGGGGDGGGVGGKDDDPAQDKGEAPTVQDIKEILEAARQSVKRSEEIKRESGQMRDMVRNTEALDINTPTIYSWARVVPTEAQPIARQIAKELRRVEEDNDPRWVTHQQTGRINIKRAMHADPMQDDIYDVWDEGGAGGTTMEVVTLLDQSSSMRNHEGQLSIAAWALKRATDLLRIHHTVLGYDKTHRKVYGPKDKATLNRYARITCDVPSTAPASALVDAFRVFEASKRQKKVLFVLTDGEWNKDNSVLPFGLHDEVIAAMNRAGVLTVLIYLGEQKTTNTHNCALYQQIDSLADFPIFTRKVLVRELKKPTRR